MDKSKTEKDTEMEIDLSRLFGALIKRAWMIGIVAVICAVLTLVSTVLFITPKYQSSVMFYVNNSTIDVGMDFSISSSDLSAAKSLVKSYIVILNTRATLNDVIDYAGVDRTYLELKGMISAGSVSDTEIFRIVVTSEDPQEAVAIANAIAHILPKQITSIIEGTSTKVVDPAVLPTAASSPNYAKNTILGFIIGLAVMAVIIVVLELLDVTIRSEEDIAQNCKHPILATVPDMAESGKGGRSYGYGKHAHKLEKDENSNKNQPTVLYGDRIGFSAAESYKLLRTKLQFSFTEENGCRVIGLTSAVISEGKSLTSINLAYSLAELGKKVILVDADMRRPTIAEKLALNKKVGLSSYLTGQGDLNQLIQYCDVSGEDKTFHVITAGLNPPNPIELLSSAKMDLFLLSLRKHYDYVIVDLPPIKEVSDALAVANKLDGMLLVVRQNFCNRMELNDAVRQLAFVDAKMLGVVFNGFSSERKGYGQHHYGSYYKHTYGRGYGRYAGSKTSENKTVSIDEKKVEQ